MALAAALILSTAEVAPVLMGGLMLLDAACRLSRWPSRTDAALGCVSLATGLTVLLWTAMPATWLLYLTLAWAIIGACVTLYRNDLVDGIALSVLSLGLAVAANAALPTWASLLGMYGVVRGVSLLVGANADPVVLECSLPGMRPEDVRFWVDGDSLVIDADSRHHSAYDAPDYRSRVYSYSRIVRRLPLPRGVDPARLRVRLDGGERVGRRIELGI